MRSILAVLLGLLAVLPTGRSAAGAQNLETLHLIVFARDAPTAIARANGSLAAAGLDVDFTITPNSTVQMQSLGDGSHDLAYTSFDNVLAWSKRDGGPELIAVAQQDRTVDLWLYVRPEIKSWQDLRGKPLAVDAPDTAFALVLRRMLLAHGLDLTRGDYSLVPVGARRVPSLVQGETFAGMLSTADAAQANAAGLTNFGNEHEVLPDYGGQVIATRREWASAHADQLVAFLRAWVQAGRFTQTNPEEAAAMFAQEADVDPQLAPRLLPAHFDDGALNPAGLQSILDLRNQFGYALPGGPNLAGYLDGDYYAAAFSEL